MLRLKVNTVCNIFKRSSALFINGQKATETFTYVTPHIDLSERLKHEEDLRQTLQKRKSSINLDKVKEIWRFYQELLHNKNNLESIKVQLGKQISELMKSNPNSDELKPLKIKLSLVKENLKDLKQPLWSAEEQAVFNALLLPNNIHKKTPIASKAILHTHRQKPEETNIDNLNVDSLVYFSNGKNYYLKNEAALFELEAKYHLSKHLKSHNFIQYSNPDFVKSLIIEGCGCDHTDPSSTFILDHNEETAVNKDSRLHLVGGGSQFSYFAYYTKNVLHAKSLPLKLFSIGRQYQPNTSKNISLFNVIQATVVQFFGVTKDVKECDELLEEVTHLLKGFYEDFDVHFQIVLKPAEKLHMWESLSLAIEVYSTSLKDYVEIANISVSDDFLSKRLQLTYKKDKEAIFPFVLSGTLLNIPKFLGCLLDQKSSLEITEKLSYKNWALK